MNENLSNTCRLCLKHCEFKFSLFSGNMIHQIESLTAIKVTKGDKLPESCCESCVANIYLSYKFQQCIIESDRKLREELIQGNTDMEVIEETKQYPHLFEITYLDDNTLTEVELNKFENVEDSLNINEIFNELNDLNQICNVENMEDSKSAEVPSSDEAIDEVNLKSSLAAYQKPQEDIKKIFKCNQCELELNSYKKLYRHMVKHNIRKCPFCSVTMRKDNLKKHIGIHIDSPGICHICGKKTKNIESLRGHINYNHKKSTVFKCEICDRIFKSRAYFNTHSRKVHLGIKDYQCDMCGKHFFANHDLNKHINVTHMGARPYACQYCKKAFTSSYARNVHIRQHTNETPFVCDICKAGFTQKISLITHLRSKHFMCC